MATKKGTIIFSNKPFASKSTGARSKFKSSDFIYARLEVPGSIETFFKMPKSSNLRDYPANVLMYNVRVKKDGDVLGRNSWPYVRVSGEVRKSDFLSFDVLPEPAIATTMICCLADYSSPVAGAPLYMMFDRDKFPENGLYTIEVELQYWAFDPYDPDSTLSRSEWPTVSGEFEFNFDISDLPALKANYAEVGELVKENARRIAMEARGLPKEWDTKNVPIATGHSEDELAALFLAREDKACKVLKVIVPPVKGPTWVIVKNNVGIPLWRWHNHCPSFFAENSGRYFHITGDLRQQYEGNDYGAIYFQWTDSAELKPDFVIEAMGGEKKSSRTTKAKSKK